MKEVILGSSSPSRRLLLSRLNITFECVSPDTDETQLPGEMVEDLVTRLSLEKAQAVAKSHGQHIIISGDQVLGCEGEVLGKPLTHENAINQLQSMSDKSAAFYTGVCIMAPGIEPIVTLHTSKIKFKTLSFVTIEKYLHADQPYHCAGSIKVESLGVALVESIESDDPTAMLGLPLISLSHHLSALGVCLF